MAQPAPREPMTRGDVIALIVWGLIYAALGGILFAYCHGMRYNGV